MKIILEKKTKSKDIQKFLEKINLDVFPILSSRVELDVYAEKIANYAECLVIRKNSEIEALSAFYCNDMENKESYLTLIAVGHSLRNQGVGKELLDETIRYAESKGMEKLVLETHKNNQPAIKLYQKCGFKTLKVENDGAVFMQYQLTRI